MTKIETIATFPETFSLKAFPGQTFSINKSASYESPLGSGQFLLYVFKDGVAFCKGTPEELLRQIQPRPVSQVDLSTSIDKGRS